MNKPEIRDAPLFSIVTVTFNAESCIDTTIKSLDGQTCRDFEWVIVDGLSSDGTLKLVESSGIEPRTVKSERDSGIYDAMNKSLDIVAGKWVYFLNAGDAFIDADVLGDIKRQIEQHPGAELFYGDMLYFSPGVERPMRFSHVSRFWLPYESLNHQSLFARKTLFDRYGRFNLKFRTSADYDWLLRVFLGRSITRYVKRRIARFDMNGTHKRNMQALNDERKALRLAYVSPLALSIGTQFARVRARWRRLRDEGY